MSGVLEGIRVLDFGRYVAGPHCASLLGDFGAEVIRIEKVDGSEDRYVAPLNDEYGAHFIHNGRNKLGLTLNPTKPDGKEVTRRLIETADVVVVNMPYHALPAMGLDYDSLKAIKPDIILTTCSAFGSKGPFAEKLGFDGVAQAMSGNMYMTGHEGEPMKNFAPYVDYSSGMLCALGTVLALYERKTSGMGQIVEGALLNTALTITNPVVMEQAVLALNRVSTGSRAPTGAPADAFQTKDNWVMVQSIGNPLFKRWVDLIGEPEWLEDPRFADDDSRGANGAVISERMSRWCGERTTQQVLEQLEAAGIPAGEVLSPQQVLDHPHVKATGMLKDVAIPGIDKPVPVMDTPISLSRTPGGIKTPPPALGEHTDSLLKSLNYSVEEIADLRSKRVV
ncbi:MAG: CoA transferase [Gammaproteobacteria bacterium]|nr:CoA transferase [Gammaproteobacteria bacterium]MBQ0840050.1 CoA transferase [Gammaproteobacteria bacterium]